MSIPPTPARRARAESQVDPDPGVAEVHRRVRVADHVRDVFHAVVVGVEEPGVRRVTITAGQQVTFDIDPPAGGSAVSPLLRLFNAAGEELALRAPDERASVRGLDLGHAALERLLRLLAVEVQRRVVEHHDRDVAVTVEATESRLQALEAVLSDIEKQEVDAVWCLGDLVGYAPWPNEVVARLRFKDRQPPGLRQNQRMSARIVLDTRRNVLMVDRGPFLEQGGGSAYVMDGDVAVRRPIQTGTSSLGAVEILGGLKEGDRVVVSGSDLFGDAERVVIN